MRSAYRNASSSSCCRFHIVVCARMNAGSATTTVSRREGATTRASLGAVVRGSGSSECCDAASWACDDDTADDDANDAAEDIACGWTRPRVQGGGRKDRPSAATSHPRTQNTGSLWHPNTTCGPRFRHGFFIVFLQTPYINRARHGLASGGRGIRRNARQAVFLGGMRGATTRLEPARFWPTARVDTPFLP